MRYTRRGICFGGDYENEKVIARIVARADQRYAVRPRGVQSEIRRGHRRPRHSYAVAGQSGH